MTVEEIEARFDSEWVLIDKLQADKTIKVTGGRVLHHGTDRNEVYRKAATLRPHWWTVLYTGKEDNTAAH